MSDVVSRECFGLDARLSLEHDDSVCQVGGHDEVMLHYEGRLLRVQNVPTTAKADY